LTWLSLILDYNLYGDNAGGYHITNLLFHIANTLLLFFLLNKMTGALYRSAFVAALFALHPLHVESVAWVSERKDVLSAFFWILTMWAYANYSRSQNWKQYMIVIFLFALGLMAKPMLVTLPFILLLMDYWPLGRMKLGKNISVNDFSTEKKSLLSLLLEKMPLFLLTLFSCVITFVAQNKYHAVISLQDISLSQRICNTLNSYAGYLEKTFWFHNLGVFYTYPDKFNSLEVAGAVILIILLTSLAAIFIKKTPYLAVGWFWYLGTLIPVIGLVQVGSQAMADRYTYIPLIGIFIMLSWGLPVLLSGIRYGKYVNLFVATVFITTVATASYHRVQIWENNFTLFGHAIEFDKRKYIAYHILGYNAAKYGDNEKALYYYYETLKINPKYDPAYVHAGNVLQKMGKLDDAINCYLKALRINNKSAEAQYNLGIALILKNRFPEAINHFTESLKINPDDADVHNNLGIALIKTGKIKEGLGHFQQSLHLNPDNLEFQKNVSVALNMVKNSR
ncbi:MAG: tetratricopeptide repeat protein, partial [Pelosinus sp.]|nr:tetratricopeptide repeat protein [Pelosinus sp.]